ncbi:hydroxymethylbilane synthase [Bacillus horti]|uniref:Porphobilinogen deaminase n=1 Tax=Caldalkalibacillus horti TaxID=77523 RepID=A0ABT9VTL7_9BACI|nr:hydroxymethylbilane synthase [Bacillus horti]MDQ0164322.1 hydroxymethylbilane synthase [Bacillus horti]
MKRTIVIGSRKSALALTQTKWVIKQLEGLGLPYHFEIKEMVTKGDQILDVMLSKVGGKGLFVKEIEQAMLDEEIDCAVHSMKDMPAVLPAGLTIGCIPRRVDARDVLISNQGVTLEQLPAGSVIGTSSLRRSAQLLALRPDLEVKWIRGNIDTRMRKLKEEEYDAIILAAAGLERMGWSEETVTQFLEPEHCLPAVGQGALGIECRLQDEDLIQLLQRIHHTQTGIEVQAERAFLARIEGGCQVPVAAYAKMVDGQVTLTGLVGKPDGTKLIKENVVGAEPSQAGKELADRLFAQGAKEILDEVRSQLDD